MSHKFKGNVTISGNLGLPAATANRALIIDGSNQISASSVTSTELGYMSGVTSAIQTQLDAKVSNSLTDGKILIGNVSNVATEQTVSGDITLSNAGVAAITSGVIVNADVNASAAIAVSKLAAVTASRALASDGSGFVSASSVTSTELGYVSGVTSAIQTQIDAKISSSEKGANNGVATLDGGGKIPVSQLPNSVMEYQGNWNASTNTPTLADGTGSAGDVYRASVAGSQDLGSGSQSFDVGDWVVYNGSIWEKSTNSNAVVSVNGQSGIVVLDSDDISEGVTNLYYTAERAQDDIGTILVDSATIDFTYSDGTPSITAIVKAASLDETHLTSGTQIPVAKIAALTASRAVVTDGSGVLSASATTSTEVGYLSGVTSAIQTQLGNKAATDLSNLITTSIPVDLLPSVDLTSNLGSATKTWSNLFAAQIKNASGNTIVDTATTEIFDLSGNFALNSDQRRLYDSSGNKALNWQSRILYASNDAAAIDFSNISTVTFSGQVLSGVGSPSVSTDAATKGYVDGVVPAEGSFSGANNQVSPANVTGFAFANASYRSFDSLVSIYVDATSPLYEVYNLRGVQKGSSWDLAQASNGDDSSVLFSITNAGQIQYTSGNYAGFNALTIKFISRTTSV